MDFTPSYLKHVVLDAGRIELVEWHWPDMIDFMKTEPELMLEMSLPPHATDASAEFPEVERGNHCFMGTLFVRFPGVTVHGRGAGGQIRVLRCTFSPCQSPSIIGIEGIPPLEVLQGLLDIRSDALRTLMRLVLREMTARDRQSDAALHSLHSLVAIELRRWFESQAHGSRNSRLAAWQYRRIRERLLHEEQPPSGEELAGLCGISVRHLNRQFLALTGSTVGAYVENFQLERARLLLRQSDFPIKEIAARLGFSHATSFARAFRRLTGVTPRVFRQRGSRLST